VIAGTHTCAHRYTIEEAFDDASAGTDARVIRVLALTQKQRNFELLNACAAGETYEVLLLLKYGASTTRSDWGR